MFYYNFECFLSILVRLQLCKCLTCICQPWVNLLIRFACHLKAHVTLTKFLGENISNGDGERLDDILVMVTLGGTTQIGSFLFVLRRQGGQGKYSPVLLLLSLLH